MLGEIEKYLNLGFELMGDIDQEIFYSKEYAAAKKLKETKAHFMSQDPIILFHLNIKNRFTHHLFPQFSFLTAEQVLYLTERLSGSIDSFRNEHFHHFRAGVERSILDPFVGKDRYFLIFLISFQLFYGKFFREQINGETEEDFYYNCVYCSKTQTNEFYKENKDTIINQI